MKRNAPRWFVHIDRKIAELMEQRPEHGLREGYEKQSSHMSLCTSVMDITLQAGLDLICHSSADGVDVSLSLIIEN